jgi:hypothetical protein
LSDGPSAPSWPRMNIPWRTPLICTQLFSTAAAYRS